MRLPLVLTVFVLFLTGCASPESNVINDSGKTLGVTDRMPSVRKRYNPVYPMSLLSRKISAEVIVEFVVDTDGNVTNPRVVHATQPGFEQSCIDCISKWKFTPGIHNGQPAKSRMQQHFTFDSRR
ncbi:MAG: energy transducer TonB [Nibricoccus sp.]